MKAIWHGAILAESDKGIVVEGNYNFPPESIATEYLRESELHTVCSWKGTASYYMFAPSLGAQDGGANKAFGSIDEDLCSYRHFFVDVAA